MIHKTTLIFRALIMIAFCASAGLAQSPNDYKRWEVSGGYSRAFTQTSFGSEVVPLPTGPLTINPCSSAGASFFGTEFQRFFCDRRGFNGFDVSVAGNFSRYLGLKGNLSGHFKSDRFVDTAPPVTNETKERLYNFLVGVQIKDNSTTTRWKPYAHALVGVAHYTMSDAQTSPVGFLNFNVSDSGNSPALKLGGGVDLRVSNSVDLRLIEINYNPIFAGQRNLSGGPVPNMPVVAQGRTAHNFTIGVGVAFH
ncbi:MAG TPA: outer membrane beta-barrel protein [Pyrinomonadaceae bacterium]|jgi:opacity protein-like surface antigen